MTIHIELLIGLLVYTLFVFHWVFKEVDRILKIFILILVAFFYIYCGLGVAYLQHPDNGYILSYIIYAATLSFFLKRFEKKRVRIPMSQSISDYSLKWSTWIIVLYMLLSLIPLITAGKMSNLISPPPPAIGDVIADTDFEENRMSNILQTITSFVYVFFLFAVFKYVKKPWLIFILFFLPLYMAYCKNGYLARSGTAFKLMIPLSIIYYFNPKTRKAILISTLSAIPFIIILFAAYVDIRHGENSENLGFVDSLNYLIESETGYPRWYTLLKTEAQYAYNYIIWLLTLPLPGFLKPFEMNFNFNALFTADVLGISLANINSISLPGLVNEGVFIFGKYFFFIHAIIFAYVFMLLYNTLRTGKCNYVALFALMLQLSLLTCRAGSTGTFPMVIKTLFVILLFYYFTPRKKRIM